MNVRVQQIAKQCRDWAVQLDVLTDHQFGKGLQGLCAIASARLVNCLHAAGYKSAQAVGNSCHFFVVWKGMIIDVTATQFGLGAIVIDRQAMLEKQHDWYTPYYVCATPRAVRTHQLKHRWPVGQMVWRELADGNIEHPTADVIGQLGLQNFNKISVGDKTVDELNLM